MRKLDNFTRAYLTCALWSSNDESTPEGGEPFDANYSLDDIAPSSIDAAISDCSDFRMVCSTDALLDEYWDAEQGGHDFWLTRNHHGAGFWDRYCDFSSNQDEIKEIGQKLTVIAHKFREITPILGDDGLIYFEG
jgi:hypothetical protein